MAARQPFQSFVATVPGLGPFVAREARALGVQPGRLTNDGRADLVAFANRPPPLRTAEDTFIAFSDITAAARALRKRRVRLVVRVQDESRFERRELRRSVAARLGRNVTDREGPDVAELWVLQTRERRLWIGLRVTPERSKRRVELPGALRPAVAAAMVQLVERPGLIVDACCGTGTIALEAEASRRRAFVGDLAPGAVDAARANGVSAVVRLDARQLPLRKDGAVAVVTNLPFGRQHLVQGAPVAWYRRVLQDALRVAPQAVVLAAPTTPFRQALGRLDVDLRGRYEITLLGNRSTIWDLRRR